MNIVVISGNLCRDPEVNFTKDGMSVCNACIAINRKRKDKEDEVTFVDITIWDKQGENFAKFHKKGDLASVSGELRMDSWDDRNGGGRRTKLKVVVKSWDFAKSERS